MDKRVKSVLLAFLVLSGPAYLMGTSKISLPGRSAVPGDSILLPLVFSSDDSTISGIQFDIEYDSTAMSLAAIVGEAARASGKRLYFADLAPNKRRFILVGPNQDLIPPGALIDVYCNLNANASSGNYMVTFSNIVNTSPINQSAAAEGMAGTLMVQGSAEEATRLQVTGVLSAASLMPGPVAPGEIITIVGSRIGPNFAQQSGPNPSSTILDGTSVLFDNIPAPLLYASSNQINAVVPYGVSGKASTQIQIKNHSQVIGEVVLPVAPTAPAIFTMDASGVGSAAILNQDSTVNSSSNPAEKGSVVALFATGAGQTDPQGVDGQITGTIPPKPLLAVSVRVGGVDAEVLYAGAAPGLIASVLQVNFRIPETVAPSHSVPIRLTVGEASSQPGIVLAVQ